jgi:hypothetical protein
MPKLTEMKHFSGVPLLGRLLALLTNTILVLKGLSGTNSLAYYKNLKITDKEVLKHY